MRPYDAAIAWPAAPRGGRRPSSNSRDVRALDELAAGLAARDDLLGVRQDSRAVARDRCQHVTGREMSAISSRV